MKFYNIFNKKSRYEHKKEKIGKKIKKHNDFLEYLNELINETNEFIKVCEEKYDLNKEDILKKDDTDKNHKDEKVIQFPIDKVSENENISEETKSNNKDYGDKDNSSIINNTESDNEEDFCIIACDGCGREFDIYKAEEVNEDGISKFVCPFCKFHNEIEDDIEDIDIDDECDEDCECESDDTSNHIDDLIKNLDSAELENELLDHLKEISSDEELKEFDKILNKTDNSKDNTNKVHKDKKISNSSVSKKVIKIPEEVIKNNKVIIKTNSNPNKIKFIRDDKFYNLLKILSKYNNINDTVKVLSDMGIELINDNNVTHISKNGNVMIKSCDDNHDIPEFVTLRTNLIMVPHGRPELFYNKVLNNAGIKKYNPEWHSIDIPGTACIVSDNNKLNALNFNIENKSLNITIVYNID